MFLHYFVLLYHNRSGVLVLRGKEGKGLILLAYILIYFGFRLLHPSPIPFMLVPEYNFGTDGSRVGRWSHI